MSPKKTERESGPAGPAEAEPGFTVAMRELETILHRIEGDELDIDRLAEELRRATTAARALPRQDPPRRARSHRDRPETRTDLEGGASAVNGRRDAGVRGELAIELEPAAERSTSAASSTSRPARR